MNEVLAHNLPFIRESLLDGFLVREGFIEGAALEALFKEETTLEPYLIEILDYVCVETWARAWQAS